MVWQNSMRTASDADHYRCEPLGEPAVPMFESEEEEKGSITVLNDEGELTDGTLNLLDESPITDSLSVSHTLVRKRRSHLLRGYEPWR